jgi:hypothetical protein
VTLAARLERRHDMAPQEASSAEHEDSHRISFISVLTEIYAVLD